MTNDDGLFRHRPRVLATAEELGNIRASCRVHGIHHSIFYRWNALAGRQELEMLRSGNAGPQMPHAISVVVAQGILAYALAFPGQGYGSILTTSASRRCALPGQLRRTRGRTASTSATPTRRNSIPNRARSRSADVKPDAASCGPLPLPLPLPCAAV